MTGESFRSARKQRGWTQTEAASRLGISQPYIALLEGGQRSIPPKLARKAARLMKLDASLLPLPEQLPVLTNDELARDLGRLGYQGFAYLRGGRLRNPGELLLSALSLPILDSRVAEALPWIVLQYPGIDQDWLLQQARLANLTNRLGFVVDLARGVAESKDEMNSLSYRALTCLAEALRRSRLDFEEPFGQEMLSEREREWLRANRPPEARFWHLLTNWRSDLLPYAR